MACTFYKTFFIALLKIGFFVINIIEENQKPKGWTDITLKNSLYYIVLLNCTISLSIYVSICI